MLWPDTGGREPGVDTDNHRAALLSLLHEYNEHPQQREQISQEIERRFRRPTAILVLDSSGFTRTTHTHGIIHFLALLERLYRVVEPVILKNRGRVLKTEADNIFAVFDDVEDATRCAVEIQHDVQVANGPLPEHEEIYVSIGVGFGNVLVIGDNDLFGDEMNLACKLGEDLAQRDEILLTPSAFGALGETEWEFEPLTFSISGLGLTAYHLNQPSPQWASR